MRKVLVVVLVLGFLLVGIARSAGVSPAYLNSALPLEDRVADLLARLTLEEKISLMSGADIFSTHAIDRLQIPALKLSDGPNGLRSSRGEAATVFPTGVAMAATWNPALIETVGQALGREARALGVQVVLGPNINLQRLPLAGRNFESYSEDPLLTARMGISFVKGVQSVGVAATPKHFVANEQELERQRVSSNVDERTLRELYLFPFEQIVKEAHPWALMSSYNRVNGTYMSEHGPLVKGVLKKEWGFDGLVVSDWGAVHSVAAAAAGLDLEMPGPALQFGNRLRQSVTNWQIEERDIDESVRRFLRLLIRTGALDHRVPAKGEIATERHRAIARTVAEEAMTLLKNEGNLLPLDLERIRSIAVIGPNADTAIIQGGGSSNVIPLDVRTPWEVLKSQLGDRVHLSFAQGVDNEPTPPPLDSRLLSPTQARTGTGLSVSYFANANWSGEAVESGIDRYFNKLGLGEGIVKNPFAPFSARWQGYFWPPRDGTYEFSLMQSGTATLYLDGKTIIDTTTPYLPPGESDIFPMSVRVAKIELRADRGYPITLEYATGDSPYRLLIAGVRPPTGTIEAAVAAAKSADVAIVFVGASTSSDSEGVDRHTLALFGAQDDLVRAVRAANPRTVVVLQNGAPLTMPWLAEVPAILEAWFPGQQGAYAIVDALMGKLNPSGKLPVTFPRRIEDTPTYLYYTKGRDADYGEGVFMGYRYYDSKDIEPLFPFGHGLSYTQFQYTNLQLHGTDPISVQVDVKNIGARSGQEVVQLYVHDEATNSVRRPLKELRAFDKVSLKPGATRRVQFQLHTRDLSYYDAHAHAWIATPGIYQVLMGSSSRDIRVKQTFEYRGEK